MREKSLPDIASLIRAARYRRKPTPVGLGSFGSATSKPAAHKRLLMNEAGIVKPP